MAGGWIESKCSIGTTVMTIMVVSTSLGAQVFKIPITKLIHSEPISLINYFQYFVGALVTFFLGAVTIVYLSTLSKNPKDKYNETETGDTESVTKHEESSEVLTELSSETSNSNSAVEESALKPISENFTLLIDHPNQKLTIMAEEFQKNHTNER